MTNINTVRRDKRRKRVNGVTVGLTFIFIVSFLILMMSLGNMDSYGDGEKEFIQIVVGSGDSLWKIAESVTPEHRDLRATMYEIVKVNDLDSEVIHPGQILKVPKVY